MPPRLLRAFGPSFGRPAATAATADAHAPGGHGPAPPPPPPRPIHVVYATDTPHGCALLGSMATVHAHARRRPVRFHVVVPPAMAAAVRASRPRLPYDATVHPMPEVPFVAQGTQSRLSAHTTAWARLYLHTFVPASATRVLYLDTDTLVDADVAELVDDTPMSRPGSWPASRPPPAVAIVRRDDGKLQAWNGGPVVGVGPDAVIHNDGVLLVDVPRWRAQRWTEQLESLAAQRTHYGLNSNGDQLLVNTLLARQRQDSASAAFLPERWNYHNLGSWLERGELATTGIYHWSDKGKWWHPDGNNRHLARAVLARTDGEAAAVLPLECREAVLPWWRRRGGVPGCLAVAALVLVVVLLVRWCVCCWRRRRGDGGGRSTSAWWWRRRRRRCRGWTTRSLGTQCLLLSSISSSEV